MSKIELSKPVLLCFYGFPGAGKSYLARNLSSVLHAAHVSGDRIRNELFENPRYDAPENAIVGHMMDYMSEEFLNNSVSVLYDTAVGRLATRRKLKEMAAKHKTEYLLVWLQIDHESAFARTQTRDRRTSDDRYDQPQTRESFNQIAAAYQNPQNEDYLVISGKHSFTTQKNTIINRLYKMGVVSSEHVQSSVIKPELVNLVPNPHNGRVDFSRRNITIR